MIYSVDQKSEIAPEYIPCKGVRTSLLLATDDLVKAPQLGIALTNDPKMLHSPKEIISWEASTTASEPAYKLRLLIT